METFQNAKLKKSVEHARALEDKLRNALNENAKLQVKQKEDEKLWKGLESKFSSAKTLSDQLTATLQHLASQVQDGRYQSEAQNLSLLLISSLKYLEFNHYIYEIVQLRKTRRF